MAGNTNVTAWPKGCWEWIEEKLSEGPGPDAPTTKAGTGAVSVLMAIGNYIPGGLSSFDNLGENVKGHKELPPACEAERPI